MRHTFLSTILLFLFVLLQSCADDENAQPKPEDDGLLRMEVLTTVGGQSLPTEAEAYFYKDGVLIDQFSLDKKTNAVPFKGVPGEEYQLVIKKNGRVRYTEPLIFDGTLRNLLLKILLVPVFELTTYSTDYFEMELGGSGTITVDWGDGNSDQYNLSGGVYPSHTYAVAGVYDITVTGDIDQITWFSSFYGYGAASSINFEYLTGLENISYGLTNGPSVIDLSNSPNLNYAYLGSINELEQLILPVSHFISYIDISGYNLLGPSDVDGVIDNIYNNAVAKNITNGSFTFYEVWYGDPPTPLGPPSAAGYAKLATLHDDYGWSIYPGDEEGGRKRSYPAGLRIDHPVAMAMRSR